MVPQLRQKAREMREAASIQRQTWRPRPDSFHYRIYRWWMHKTTIKNRRKVVAQENFCHYWRVVLIWVPLHLIARVVAAVAAVSIVATVITLMVLNILSIMALLAILVVIVAIIAYLAAGVLVAMQMVYQFTDDYFDNMEDSWLDHRSEQLRPAAQTSQALPVGSRRHAEPGLGRDPDQEVEGLPEGDPPDVSRWLQDAGSRTETTTPSPRVRSGSCRLAR